MSTVNNENYHTNNSSINIHIDNILSFRDFLNTVLNEIKSGEYNTLMIKKISQMVEKFYNDISDEDELFKPNMDNLLTTSKLTPKLIETYEKSDSDAESDITIFSGSDSDIPKSGYSITNYFSHKTADIYSDEDDQIMTSLNTSVIANYGKLREQKVAKLDYYESLYEQHKKEIKENLQIEDIVSTIDQVKKPKIGDKLAEAFLNNNLELNKYYYLKNFNQNNINNFCKSCYVY